MTLIIGPDLEVQGAIVAALGASIDMKSLLGNPIRLYQKVPNNPTFPYVTIGESQTVPDIAECVDGSIVYPVLHIWSQPASGSYEEAKKIAANIWAVLRDASITLTENRCLIFERDELGDQIGEETDTVTKHIASHYRAVTEPA